MTIKVTCEGCGATFTRERDPSKSGPRFRLCDACKRARKRAHDRACHAKERANQLAERAAASAKVVKRCHRCGRTFDERPIPNTTISAADSTYISHRYARRALGQ